MGNSIKFPLWTNYMLFKKFHHLLKIISERNVAQLNEILASMDPAQRNGLLNNQLNENGSTLLMLACVYGILKEFI